jgi:hypothetical protein
MVVQSEQPIEKTAEEIAQEAGEEIAPVAQLAQEADLGKRHNGR